VFCDGPEGEVQDSQESTAGRHSRLLQSCLACLIGYRVKVAWVLMTPEGPAESWWYYHSAYTWSLTRLHWSRDLE
jgi:4-hydroxybenzoate polyprenyltransferase